MKGEAEHINNFKFFFGGKFFKRKVSNQKYTVY